MLRDGVTIYFVRHGQTQWNARGLAQGTSDIELNTLGRDQARVNGKRLANLVKDTAAKLDYVSSPLKRAKETMEILRTALGLPAAGYSVDPRLKELGFGVSEGTSWPEYAQRLTDAHKKSGADPWAFAADGGGESYATLSARVMPFFAELERDTVVACHGGVSRCIQVAMGGTTPIDAINMAIPQDRIMVMRGKELRWA